jgi:hypothetical protein
MKDELLRNERLGYAQYALSEQVPRYAVLPVPAVSEE